MSWYMEPYESSSSADSARSDKDTADALAGFLGAASGVMSAKGAILAGCAVAGPIGGTIAGIGWVGFCAVKSVWIRNALRGKEAI